MIIDEINPIWYNYSAGSDFVSKEENNNETKQNNIAIYCRLSLDDRNEGDSSSIQTQKMMLEQYARSNNFNIVDY